MGVSGIPLYPKSLKIRINANVQREGRTIAETSDQNGDVAEQVVDVKSFTWVMSDNTKHWQMEMSRLLIHDMLTKIRVAEINKFVTGLFINSLRKPYSWISLSTMWPGHGIVVKCGFAVIKLLTVAPNLDFSRGYIFLLHAIIHNLRCESRVKSHERSLMTPPGYLNPEPMINFSTIVILHAPYLLLRESRTTFTGNPQP